MDMKMHEKSEQILKSDQPTVYTDSHGNVNYKEVVRSMVYLPFVQTDESGKGNWCIKEYEPKI